MAIHHLNCGTLCPYGGQAGHRRGRLRRAPQMCCHCLLIETGDALVLVDTGFGADDVRPPAPAPRGAVHGRLPAPGDARRDGASSRSAGSASTRPTCATSPSPTSTSTTRAGCPTSRRRGARVRARARGRACTRSSATAPAIPASHVAHGPRWVEHTVDGDRWFGFESVRVLPGVDPEVALIPLLGHSRGHSAIAVRDGDGWLLHCGDAYFHRGEVASPPSCPPGLRMFQTAMAADNGARVAQPGAPARARPRPRRRGAHLLRPRPGRARAGAARDERRRRPRRGRDHRQLDRDRPRLRPAPRPGRVSGLRRRPQARGRRVAARRGLAAPRAADLRRRRRRIRSPPPPTGCARRPAAGSPGWSTTPASSSPGRSRRIPLDELPPPARGQRRRSGRGHPGVPGDDPRGPRPGRVHVLGRRPRRAPLPLRLQRLEGRDQRRRRLAAPGDAAVRRRGLDHRAGGDRDPVLGQGRGAGAADPGRDERRAAARSTASGSSRSQALSAKTGARGQAARDASPRRSSTRSPRRSRRRATWSASTPRSRARR